MTATCYIIAVALAATALTATNPLAAGLLIALALIAVFVGAGEAERRQLVRDARRRRDGRRGYLL